ncbi:hypothetical protein I6N95_21580 [Vagococcus sp. BWB3-3]|uniref:Uncharacterized protein n=1 Tax=Vagococcus allomyrinae TaxID=2794353 RepID=A0A940PFG3_9ENTE|nr:hypothetical protein [Vagococcus allomyrinae]MBP1043622.1 hypothetical protein [Vagococcus allomyrinae]
MEEEAVMQLKFRGRETTRHTYVQLSGGSHMPFWRHDLKFSAVIGLLSTINRKDYGENEAELERACQEIEALVKELREQSSV